MAGTAQITNPAGAFGQTDLQTGLFSVEGEGKASAAIVGPAVVAIGTDGRIATAGTNTTVGLNIGVATSSIAAGKVGSFVVLGIAENVPCAGAVAAGDSLKASVTTAGYVSTTATPAAGELVGIAINASSGGTVDVWVLPA